MKKRKEAEKIVKTETEKAELVIFIINEDYYAFYGSDIKEILPYEQIAFVPGCPDYIIGIINVRGDIESVIDLHRMMNLPEIEINKSTRIIIAEKNGIRSGILVDSVEDVIEVAVEAIKHPIATLDKRIKEFAIGGETIYADKYVTILDIGKIFEKIQ